MNSETGKEPLISIVMPALNERDGLPGVVRAVAAQLSDTNHEIIVVDDGSTDGTWDTITSLSNDVPATRGLRFSRNFGHQSALLAGMEAARGEAVIMMDSDGQHPAELIPELLAKWRLGAAVVQTLRADASATGVLKRSSSRGFYRLFSWLAGTNIPAGSADFRLLDRRAVDVVLTHPKSALFLRGFIPWTGLETAFVEFEPKPRLSGKTKYSAFRMFNLARQGIIRFSVKPLRLATLIGGLTCVGSLVYLGYVLVTRLLGGHYVEGWASVAGLLALIGGIQLIIMGILGEYVGMIFETQLDRPPFVIAEQLERKEHIPPPAKPET